MNLLEIGTKMIEASATWRISRSYCRSVWGHQATRDFPMDSCLQRNESDDSETSQFDKDHVKPCGVHGDVLSPGNLMEISVR